MNSNQLFFYSPEQEVSSLGKEVYSFINNLLEKSFEFKAMTDPHQGWLKNNKETIPKKNIKYRLQLHLVPPRDMSEAEKEQCYVDIMKFFAANMTSLELFAQFEKVIVQYFVEKFNKSINHEKIIPNSDQDQLDYLASEHCNLNDRFQVEELLKEKKSSLINFINPKATYSWTELFLNEDDEAQMEQWKDFDKNYGNKPQIELWGQFMAGYEKGHCSVGFEDWPGALTVRGGFVTIENGILDKIELARPPKDRYEQKMKLLVEENIARNGQLLGKDNKFCNEPTR